MYVGRVTGTNDGGILTACYHAKGTANGPDRAFGRIAGLERLLENTITKEDLIMKNLFDFTGRVAVVTGASRRLGADAARAYVAQGADVALLARRAEKLEALADELRCTGRRVEVLPCDVTDEEQVKQAVEAVVARLGRIDILLNNAGVAIRGSVEELSAEEWDSGMNTNLRGMFFMCKYVVPHMRAQHYGRIVNISSVNARIADKNPALVRHVYNASKAGVRGLTLGMAASYGMDNITVNAVRPGISKAK